MSQIVYINPQGIAKSNVSYSARLSFTKCKRYFKLSRIDGWKQKQENASLLFGKAVEAAIQFHVENGGTGGYNHFITLWERVKTIPNFENLHYAKTEQNWENLLHIGEEMLLIFQLRLPSLPIPIESATRFQVPLTKEIFPGSRLAGINNLAYIDLLTHPEGKPLIIDIKTASGPMHSSLISLDAQLIEYAWQTGIHHVGFLWLVKKGRELKSGDTVTLLKDYGEWKAGEEYVLLTTLERADNAPVVLIGTTQSEAAYETAIQVDGKTLRGKSLLEAKYAFADKAEGVQVVETVDLSKQRVQFATVHLDPQDVLDAGRRIGLTTVEMVSAHEGNFYPKEPGIRWPHDVCVNCEMRWICSNDPAGRDEHLVRAGDEWMEDADGE